MEDSYQIIAREATAEIKVKGSRFIGETCIVDSVEEAIQRLEAIRKREYNATHHCYAWLVGLGTEQQFKYSDDGEPSGTAGKPIYDVVAGSGAVNLLCVVTRYYGGTKLGTGGLVRAYSEAARVVMTKSGIETRFLTDRLLFKIDFSLYDRWQKIMHGFEAAVVNSEFTDSVSLEVSIRQSRTQRLLDAFTELTSGKGHVEKL